MMNSQQQSGGDTTSGGFQSSPSSAGYNSNTTNDGMNDLQFTTSIDTSVRQNVPIPAIIPASQMTMNNNNINNNNNNNNTNTNNDSVLSAVFKGSTHPTICLFHCLFKSLALLIYIASGWFSHERFIIITVTCVVLLAMDFWVVKNVSGRLLVGLRWWSQSDGADGTETKWIFESNGGEKPVNSLDQSVFWMVLYVTPLVWGGLFLVGVLKFNFKWLITVCFGVALSGANTYGYYQCSKDQKAKFQQMMVRGAEMGAMTAIRNSNVLGKIGSFAAGLVKFGTSSANGNANANANANANQQYNQVQQPQQQQQQYNQQQQPQQQQQQQQQYNQVQQNQQYNQQQQQQQQQFT